MIELGRMHVVCRPGHKYHGYWMMPTFKREDGLYACVFKTKDENLNFVFDEKYLITVKEWKEYEKKQKSEITEGLA